MKCGTINPSVRNWLHSLVERISMALQKVGEQINLAVTNFGPIQKADIDLRPLTVFVGPSNTGKSYMAILVYALHQFFLNYASIDPFMPLSSRLRMRSMLISQQDQPALSDDSIEDFLAWTMQELQTNAQQDAKRISDLPDFIAELIKPVLNDIGEFNEVLRDEIIRCFGVPKINNLLRYHDSSASRFALRSSTSSSNGTKTSLGYNFSITSKGLDIEAAISDGQPLKFGQSFYPWGRYTDTLSINLDELPFEERSEFMEFTGEEAVNCLYSDVVSNIVGPLNRRAHYLPADRAGVMHAHQVAVRSLIASASRTALGSNLPMPALSGVLGDFLEQLVELAGSRVPPRHYRPYRRRIRMDDGLAQALESEILGGTVGVNRTEIDYPSFVYRPDTWHRDLPLMNASSMVSELAPVVLYLRQVVRPGEVLIVEEPESHLHPEMQVEFIRLLAGAVRSGIRLIITTHSEWVLEELANLVRMFDLPADHRNDLQASDYALDKQEVGAWFFEPQEDGKGSVVREIPLDIEVGGFPSGFGLITEDLYNRWAVISNRIREI